MVQNKKTHNVRLDQDVYEFIEQYGKTRVIRRKGVDPIKVSFSYLLREYIKDHGGEL